LTRIKTTNPESVPDVSRILFIGDIKENDYRIVRKLSFAFIKLLLMLRDAATAGALLTRRIL